MPSTLLFEAQMRDLSRRIDQLERLIHGTGRTQWPAPELAQLYVEACRTPKSVTSELAKLWDHTARNLDVVQLIVLARYIRDPFPWRPFLNRLDHLTQQGFDMEEATGHLLAIARDMMDAQGMTKLQPEDVLKQPLLTSDAFSTIR